MKKVFLLLFFVICYSFNLIAQNNSDSLNYYLGKFQYFKAIEYIDKQEPDRDLLFQKALCYKALRDYKSSSLILQLLTTQFPEDIAIKSELAAVYEADGMLNAGVDCYDQLLAVDSGNVFFKTRKAELLFMDRAYPVAIELYHNIYNETKAIALLNRVGVCYERLNEIDSARYYYDMAWGIDSTNAFAAASLVNIKLKQRLYNDAIVLSEIFIHRDSLNKQMNLLNALGYYGTENYEESAKRFMKCYQAGDSSLIVNRSLGISFHSLNDSYNAYSFLGNAFRQDTTDNNVLYFLALASNDIGESQESISHLNKLLNRVIPADGLLYLCYNNLASAYSMVAEYDKVVDNYIKALDYSTDNQKVMLYYYISSLVEFNLRDNKMALYYYQQYEKSLVKYLAGLKEEENPNEYEIEDISKKIKNLADHIKQLEKEVAGK